MTEENFRKAQINLCIVLAAIANNSSGLKQGSLYFCSCMLEYVVDYKEKSRLLWSTMLIILQINIFMWYVNVINGFQIE